MCIFWLFIFGWLLGVGQVYSPSILWERAKFILPAFLERGPSLFSEHSSRESQVYTPGFQESIVRIDMDAMGCTSPNMLFQSHLTHHKFQCLMTRDKIRRHGRRRRGKALFLEFLSNIQRHFPCCQTRHHEDIVHPQKIKAGNPIARYIAWWHYVKLQCFGTKCIQCGNHSTTPPQAYVHVMISCLLTTTPLINPFTPL
jgi:hypothetical protein